MADGKDKVLSECDKDTSVSDTVFYSEVIRESFPRDRYGGAKAAIYAAYRFISPRVSKQFTERRARSIWEGTARRIDAEEAAALRIAQIEEARREQKELRDRLARLDAAIAAIDQTGRGEAFPEMQPPMGRSRGMDRTGTEG